MKRRLLVVSPHLDDAVLSCGRALAAHPGSCVVTLFAGEPVPGTPRTPWDAECGFDSSEDAVRMRRREDAAAMAALGAIPCWLDFRDSQYGGDDSPTVLADALCRILAEREDWTVILPLGLDHPDHCRAREAGMTAWRRSSSAHDWLMYEDVPYRARRGAVTSVMIKLATSGVDLSQEHLPTARLARKLSALGCYRSQFQPLIAGHGLAFADVLRRERYWRLV